MGSPEEVHRGEEEEERIRRKESVEEVRGYEERGNVSRTISSNDEGENRGQTSTVLTEVSYPPADPHPPSFTAIGGCCKLASLPAYIAPAPELAP